MDKIKSNYFLVINNAIKTTPLKELIGKDIDYFFLYKEELKSLVINTESLPTCIPVEDVKGNDIKDIDYFSFYRNQEKSFVLNSEPLPNPILQEEFKKPYERNENITAANN